MINVYVQGTENRKKGWQILVNSCAAISTKTVLLLKIVYGVEVKRILAASKVAMSKVKFYIFFFKPLFLFTGFFPKGQPS